jgi:hypothetical protein
MPWRRGCRARGEGVQERDGSIESGVAGDAIARRPLDLTTIAGLAWVSWPS